MSSINPFERNLNESQEAIAIEVISAVEKNNTIIPVFDKQLRVIRNLSYTEIFQEGAYGLVSTRANAGNTASSVASAAISIAQLATNSQGAVGMAYAAAAGTTVVVSATGIGLVVVAGVLTLGMCAISVRSAMKTKGHIDGLLEVVSKKNTYNCTKTSSERTFTVCSQKVVDKDGKEVDRSAHDIILENVLPYIIDKKYAKLYRKSGSAVPLIGAMCESFRAVGKGAYKKYMGTKGVARIDAAYWLAHHWQTHRCEASDAIIVEILIRPEAGSDPSEIFASIQSDSLDALAGKLAEKMKST